MNLYNLVFASHLDQGEKILAVAHRSTFILFKASGKTFFFGMFLPVVFYLFLPQFMLFEVIWFGAGLFGMLYHFIDWYFDALLITNTGVIDIFRNGLLDRTSTRIEYHMIEGISYTITGFWATILGFGDLTIDKLGTQTSVVLKDAAKPKSVERLIMKYQDKFVGEKSYRDHQALKDMLSDMIAYHVQNEKINNPKK